LSGKIETGGGLEIWLENKKKKKKNQTRSPSFGKKKAKKTNDSLIARGKRGGLRTLYFRGFGAKRNQTRHETIPNWGKGGEAIRLRKFVTRREGIYKGGEADHCTGTARGGRRKV